VPLQSESGRKLLQRSGRSPDDISSVVLVEKDRCPNHKLPSFKNC
jgi:predicted DCC family thiol-disulfide oxidoreductase YuxK